MQKKYALILPLAVSACVSHPAMGPTNKIVSGEVVTHRYPAQYKVGEFWGIDAAPTEFNMSCAQFLKLMDDRKPTTVNQALEIVKEKYPKYLSRHTFVFSSRSLQDSDFNFPRAVVYGGDAKTILTFNGRADQKGYERIELMCFDDKSREFKFRDLAFPVEAKNEDVISDLKPNQRKFNVVVSPIGGVAKRACVQCHQQPARPIWDTYNIWPGFYGAHDDISTDPSRRRPEDLAPYDHWEATKFKTFMQGERKRGRYAILPPMDVERTNDELGRRLSFLNGERIIAELKRLGLKFETQKYHFAKALFCPPPIIEKMIHWKTGENSSSWASANFLYPGRELDVKEVFLDMLQTQNVVMERMASTGEDHSLSNEESPYSKIMTAKYREYFPEIKAENGAIIDLFEVEIMNGLKKVMAPFGLDVKNWGMTLLGGYTHSNGMDGPGRTTIRIILQRFFVRDFLKNDPELSEMLKKYEVEEAERLNRPSGPPDYKMTSPEFEKIDREVCETVDKRIAAKK